MTKFKEREDTNFRIMPMDEMRAVLLTIPRSRDHKFWKNNITIADIKRECGLDQVENSYLGKIERGVLTKHARPGIARDLTRFLSLYRAGLVVKRDNKIVYLSDPPPDFEPPKPPIRHRVTFSPAGRPRLQLLPVAPLPKKIDVFFGKMLLLER
jgi:hypothetical protein